MHSKLRRFIPVLVLTALLACAKTPFTGSNVLILTSEAQEAQLGEEAYRQTLAKYRESSRRDWQLLVDRVGERIARAAEKPEFKWEFRLIESKEANAFCLPGGKVAIYTGMMQRLENEAQLAAVLGHEVGHATARHGGQRITMQMGTQLGFSALMALLGGDEMPTEKKLLLQALGLGVQIGTALPFSRHHENEADYIGVQYMAIAGYDPRAAVRVWENFGKSDGGRPPEWLSTHPAPETRVRELQGKLNDALQRYASSPRYGLGEAIRR